MYRGFWAISMASVVEGLQFHPVAYNQGFSGIDGLQIQWCAQTCPASPLHQKERLHLNSSCSAETCESFIKHSCSLTVNSAWQNSIDIHLRTAFRIFSRTATSKACVYCVQPCIFWPPCPPPQRQNHTAKGFDQGQESNLPSERFLA